MNMIQTYEKVFNYEKDSCKCIANDLERLAKLLERHALAADNSPLYSAAKQVKQQKKVWTYSINNFSFFTSDRIVKAIPKNSRVTSISVNFIGTGLICERLKARESEKVINPFEKKPYLLEINILGSTADDEELFAFWHLDKDIREAKDGSQSYLHPEYHWTFGGWQLIDKCKSKNNSGDLIILPTPRIAHPPLDGVLAIDYIMRHFFTHKYHSDLTENTEYRAIVKRSQYRLWRNYALAFASHWVTFSDKIEVDSSFNARLIMPELYE